MTKEKEIHFQITRFQNDLASYLAKNGKTKLAKSVNCATSQLTKFATGECLPRVDTYYNILELINE